MDHRSRRLQFPREFPGYISFYFWAQEHPLTGRLVQPFLLELLLAIRPDPPQRLGGAAPLRGVLRGAASGHRGHRPHARLCAGQGQVQGVPWPSCTSSAWRAVRRAGLGTNQLLTWRSRHEQRIREDSFEYCEVFFAILWGILFFVLGSGQAVLLRSTKSFAPRNSWHSSPMSLSMARGALTEQWLGRGVTATAVGATRYPMFALRLLPRQLAHC